MAKKGTYFREFKEELLPKYIPAVIDKYLPGKKVSDAKVGDIDAIRLIIKDLGTL